MQSMTGYGKAEYQENGINIVVEIKTVNNRFLDIIPKYPRAFISLDDAIRKAVQAKITRGRAELFINYSNLSDSGKTVEIDESLAAKYVLAAKELSEKFSLLNDFTVANLMRSPDVIEERVSDGISETIKEKMIETLNFALDNLNAMRKIEGEKLKADIEYRVGEAKTLISEIEKRAPLIKKEYEEKLRAKITEMLGDAKFDESRILQEVAIFADRTNIDEELTRLKSHVSQLYEIIKGNVDVGKKLDFLMQEFNREANTICSKSNDIEITRFALALKNEIEKMREQVQNIE
ncbi:MAG: YicC family protein [Clostridia bacterium]|nr:YicC family protein [Clostridia bacterium]